MMDIDVFKDYEIKQQLCGSFGKGNNKSINVVVNIWNQEQYFTVVANQIKIYKTFDLQKALDIYNNIDCYKQALQIKVNNYTCTDSIK